MAIIDKYRVVKEVEIKTAFENIGKTVTKLTGDLDLMCKQALKFTKALGGAENLTKIIDIAEKTKKTTTEISAADKEMARIKKELATITEKLTALHTDEANQLIKLKTAYNQEVGAINESITGKKKAAQASKELSDAEKKLEQEKRSRSALESQRSKAYVAAKKLEAQEATTASKLLISAQNAQRGTAQQLFAVNNILANRMKQISVLTVEGAEKYKQLDAAMQRNKARITEMNHAAQQQGGMFKNLAQSIITYAAAYVSVQSVIQLGKSIINQTKELDKLSFSLKTVIKDTDELALTQSFLSNVATKYGSDLLSISERYIKFRAAAIQANLSAIATQKIFDSVSKAAGVLGLKVDETAGIYLALEQMLSKGKVTTEELRRQLGERLPGAFGIMAKTIQTLNPNLKVTLSTLDKMLKNGEIMSAEVLPQFAIEMEKALGIESINKVDTLTAATGRFSTAWTLLIGQMKASSVISGVTDWLTNQLTLISTGIDIATNKGKDLLNIIQRIPFVSDEVLKQIKIFDALSMKEVEAENERRIKLGEDGILWKQYYQQRIIQEKLLQKEKANAKEFDVDKFKSEIEGKKKSYEDLKKLTDKNSREEYKQKQSIYEENYKLELAAQLKTIKAKEIVAKYKLEKNPDNESFLFLTKDLSDARLFLEMEYYDATKKLNDKSAKEKEAAEKRKIKEWMRLGKEGTKIIEENQKEEDAAFIKGVNKSTKELEDSQKMLSDFEVENSRATISELQLEREEAAIGQLRATKGNADQILKVQQDLARDLIQIDIDQTEWLLKNGEITTDERIKQERRLRDLKLAMAKESFQTEKENTEKEKQLNAEKVQAVGEIVNAGFEFTQQTYANQEARIKSTYEKEKTAAGDNVEAKIIADRKYEDESLKIRKRQAIAEKVQAAFSIALNTAIAVMKVAGQTGVGAVLAVPLIVALGAVQLATVLSKPIPEYFKGKKGTPSTFIAGDDPNSKGASELIELKTGESLLTPDEPTLFSDKKFEGATVFPHFHDKTQRMLNNYAVNQGAKVFVDMNKTNKKLDALIQNTKGKTERFTDSKGRQFIKRGSVISEV